MVGSSSGLFAKVPAHSVCCVLLHAGASIGRCQHAVYGLGLPLLVRRHMPKSHHYHMGCRHLADIPSDSLSGVLDTEPACFTATMQSALHCVIIPGCYQAGIRLVHSRLVSGN